MSVLLACGPAGADLATPPAEALPAGAIARLGRTQFRHVWPVWALAYSPDGKLLASTGQVRNPDGRFSGVIRLWDAQTGLESRPPLVHGNVVQHLAFARGGELLLSGSAGPESLRVWETATGKQMLDVPVKSPPARATISPDGKLLSAAVDGQVWLWDAATGKQTSKVGDGFSACFSPDSARLAVGGGVGKRLAVYEVPDGKEVFRCAAEDATKPVGYHCVAFSPDGKRIAAGGPQAFSFLLCDAQRGKEIGTAEGPGTHWLVFSPDGRRVAAGHYDNTVRLYDVAGLKERHRLPVQIAQCQALAFSPDGNTLATGSGEGFIRFWDTESGKERLAEAGHRSAVACLAFSPDGKSLVTGGLDGRVLLWNPPATRPARTVVEHAGPVGFVEFSPDGKRLAYSCVSAGAPAAELRVTEVESGKVILHVPGPRNLPFGHAAAFSPDGGGLITVDGRGQIVGTALNDGKELFRGRVSAAAYIPTAAFSPGGRLAAIAEEDTLRIVEVETARDWLSFRSGYVFGRFGLTFCPQGDLLAYNFGPDARLIEVASGGLALTLAANKPPRPVRGQWRAVAVAVSPDGRLVAAGANDGTIRVWDAIAGAELAVLEHAGLVNALSFSPDGKTLASAADDGTALVWSLGDANVPKPTSTAKFDEAKMSDLWADLAGADAAKAYASMWAIAAANDAAVAFLAGEMRPAVPADANGARALIADLGSPKFAVRAKADEELKKMGRSAKAQLRRALEAAADPETRARLEGLLTALGSKERQTPEELRHTRAVGALERIGSAKALAALEELARGAPGADLTDRAREAAERLAAGREVRR
jgi:WD40 repeat protein